MILLRIIERLGLTQLQRFSFPPPLPSGCSQFNSYIPLSTPLSFFTHIMVSHPFLLFLPSFPSHDHPTCTANLRRLTSLYRVSSPRNQNLLLYITMGIPTHQATTTEEREEEYKMIMTCLSTTTTTQLPLHIQLQEHQFQERSSSPLAIVHQLQRRKMRQIWIRIPVVRLRVRGMDNLVVRQSYRC